MLIDPLKVRGKLSISINGEVVREVDNLVVTTGKNFVASRIVGTATDVMSHMALGTGGTAAAAGDTALGAEVGRSSLISASVVDNEVTYAATFGAGVGTGTIVEAGIFNAASAGDMFCRTVFSAIAKGASDSMTITWTVTVS